MFIYFVVSLSFPYFQFFLSKYSSTLLLTAIAMFLTSVMDGKVQAMVIIVAVVCVPFVILPLLTFFRERHVRRDVLRPNVCRRIMLTVVLKLIYLETVFI